MARPVVGVFKRGDDAERAIMDLKQAGFDTGKIGLLMKSREEAKDIASDTGIKPAAGAVTGGALGAGLGAILAATGTLVIPGIGPFVSAGILATAIAGGAVGAIAGGLAGLGIPKAESEYYEDRVRAGDALVTVDPSGHESEAREILLRDGAEDTWRTPPWVTSPGSADTAHTAPDMP